MNRLIYILGMVNCLCLMACQQQVEGCMNPLAENFNPEADVPIEEDCRYYQLELEWQHYSQHAPDDSLRFGTWLTDAAGASFYLERCDWMGSMLHLKPVGSSTFATSPTRVLLYKDNNSVLSIEDNFFLMSLDQFSTNATGWATLGSFEQLSLQMGIADNLQGINPSKTPINNHPLSAMASPYLYDSTRADFNTLELVAVQPNPRNRRIVIQLSDVFDFNFPYAIQVEDGINTPIRIRLNYDVLLAGVSFDNDSIETIKTKLRQNIPSAFSVY